MGGEGPQKGPQNKLLNVYPVNYTAVCKKWEG